MSLTINSVAMPEPKQGGVVTTREKVWSADTGRLTDGDMYGTLVAIKTKVAISWPPLTWAQVKLIEAAVSDIDTPWSTMTYTDMTGEEKTLTVYFGTPTYTSYSWADGIQYVTDCSVDGIEK
ncbi:MAG: hypothetical protein LUD69_07315 [Oscillospiraceae bacterium]|nr:hypothetical protein [Oscillospiraceae bacterium]